jgi:hypothetical protein
MDSFGPEPMTDAELDREIAAAVNVEPSPAFVARVRQRIAREAIRPKWYLSWIMGAAAVLAVAVVGAVFLRIDRSKQADLRVPHPVIESRTVAAISELPPDRRSGRLSPTTNPRSSAGSGVSRASTGMSDFSRTALEILIDVREANALRALFAGASVARIDVMPLSTITADTGSELTQPAEIVVPPLSIQPLAPEPGEGARP